jgi:hypothetical protein
LIFVIFIIVNFILLKTIDSVDLIPGFIAPFTETTGHWDVVDIDLLEILDLRRLHHSLEKGFKVVDKTHLAWLTDTLAVGKAPRAEELSGFVHGLAKATEEQEAACRCTSTTFA